jgi:hypothetical protein
VVLDPEEEIMSEPLRIAMWSGPRNISTALMRSWGNRPDTFVCDEPFYAHFLRETGRNHPGADEVIAHQENDWRKVAAWLTGPIPEGKAIFYQKQMSHHLLPHIERGWLDRVTSCFLIREPREVITSYIKKAPDPEAQDTGFPQLAEIFTWVREHAGQTPPILDARDVLGNPRRMLGLLCDALGVEFSERMLSWPPGLRPTDGIWAKHWYAEVVNSTSFQPYQPKPDAVPERLVAVYDQCCTYYQMLYPHRLR